MTAAERKQRERDRHRDAGRVAVTVWIDPRDRSELNQFVVELNAKRLGFRG